LRTAVYVDGFNLFYRALRGTSYRWLDLLSLSQQLLKPQNRVVLLRYFTARVNPTSADPTKHVRQDTYLRALQAHIPCVHIHEGSFLKNVTTAARSNPAKGEPKYVEIIKTEEKGSDVNLAVHLVNDAWQNRFDVALVISNDSDLAEGIRLARERGLPVGVANPCREENALMNYKLYSVASFQRRIEEKHLRRSLLPELIPGTNLHKPAGW
jgi:NYN domain